MITVKQVKDAGFELTNNDRIITGKVNKVSKRVYNLHSNPNYNKYYDDRIIDCFEYRSMRYDIDLNDGMIVDVIYSSGVESTQDSKLVNWHGVKQWRPSMENWKTETPQEKEALNAIAQVDSEEWKDGLPPVGSVVLGSFHYDKDTAKEWRIDFITESVGVYTVIETGEQYTFATRDVVFHKKETQQQREYRERLEAAFEIYLAFWSASKSTVITMNISEFKECDDLHYWLAVVDKTGYRKESK